MAKRRTNGTMRRESITAGTPLRHPSTDPG